MAKKEDDLSADDLRKKYDDEDYKVEGLDETQLEEIPVQDFLLDVVTKDKDNWRFACLLLIFVIIFFGWFLYSLSNRMSETPVLVYNQATGQSIIAQSGDYQSEGFLSSVTRSVKLFNSWDYDTFNNQMSLVRDVFDDLLIKSSIANYNKKKSLWVIDSYAQEFIISSTEWPKDSEGNSIKWMPGLNNFTVIINGTFVIKRKDVAKKFPISLSVNCQIVTPSVKHPQGFKIIKIIRM